MALVWIILSGVAEAAASDYSTYGISPPSQYASVCGGMTLPSTSALLSSIVNSVNSTIVAAFPDNIVDAYLTTKSTDQAINVLKTPRFVIYFVFLVLGLVVALVLPIVFCCCKSRMEKQESNEGDDDVFYTHCQMGCAASFALALGIIGFCSSIIVLTRMTNQFQSSSNSVCGLYLSLQGVISGTVAPDQSSFYVGLKELLKQLIAYKGSFAVPITAATGYLSSAYTALTVSSASTLTSLQNVYTTASNPSYAGSWGVTASTFKEQILGTHQGTGVLGTLYKSVKTGLNAENQRSQNLLTQLGVMQSKLPIVVGGLVVVSLSVEETNAAIQQVQNGIDQNVQLVKSVITGVLSALTAVAVAGGLLMLGVVLKMVIVLNKEERLEEENMGCFIGWAIILNLLTYLLVLVLAILVPFLSSTCSSLNRLYYNEAYFRQVSVTFNLSAAANGFGACLPWGSKQPLLDFNEDIGLFVKSFRNFTIEANYYSSSWTSADFNLPYIAARYSLDSVATAQVLDLDPSSGLYRVLAGLAQSKCQPWVPNSYSNSTKIKCPSQLKKVDKKCAAYKSTSQCPKGCYGFTNPQQLYLETGYQANLNARFSSLCPDLSSSILANISSVVQNFDRPRTAAVGLTMQSIQNNYDTSGYPAAHSNYQVQVQRSVDAFATLGPLTKNKTGTMFGSNCDAVTANLVYFNNSLCGLWLTDLASALVFTGLFCLCSSLLVPVLMLLRRRLTHLQGSHLKYLDSSRDSIQ